MIFTWWDGWQDEHEGFEVVVVGSGVQGPQVVDVVDVVVVVVVGVVVVVVEGVDSGVQGPQVVGVVVVVDVNKGLGIPQKVAFSMHKTKPFSDRQLAWVGLIKPNCSKWEPKVP